MIVPVNTNSSFPGFSAGAGTPTNGAPADQGFFGLLLTQVGGETTVEAAPAGLQVEANDMALPGLGSATANELAAPFATTLLLGQAWLCEVGVSSELPAQGEAGLTTPVATQNIDLAAPAFSTVSLDPANISADMAELSGSTSESEIAADVDSDTETTEEDFSSDPKVEVLAAALLVPMPAPATSGAVSIEVPAAAISALDVAGSKSMAGVGDNVPGSDENALLEEAALADSDAGIENPVTQPQTAPKSAKSHHQASQSAEGGIDLSQINVPQPEVQSAEAARAAIAQQAEGKQVPPQAEHRELSSRAEVARAAEQPAVAAAAASPTPAVQASSSDRPLAEIAPAPAEGVAGISDTDQSGTGGLDQFPASVSHEGAMTKAASHGNAAQADFKSMVATADMSAQPHRAVQIATVHLEKAAASRNTDALTIQLEPLDLGKIEVRLDFGNEGRVHASIVADKIETLDLLQRDSRSLERALQSAGLSTDSGSLNFNLRGDTNSGRDFGQRAARGRSPSFGQQDVSEIQIVAARPSLGAAGRVDIRI